MTPHKRTLKVLSDLDEMLSAYKKKQSTKLKDKIFFSLSWINKNLDREVVTRLLRENYFEHDRAIIGLLGENEFNPDRYN